jgi:MFS family permease
MAPDELRGASRHGALLERSDVNAVPPVSSLPAPALQAARRRILWSLVAGVGLGSTGYIAAVTVATIVAGDLAGTSAWAGVPGAAVVLGSAAGSTLLSGLMVRRGRRTGLTLGYVIGAGGALLAALAVVVRSFPLLLMATVLMGFANSSNQLSRYTAADMFSPTRRASAIGIVVWGATVGAIIGPNLVSFADDAATSIGLPALSGAYLILVLFVGAAAALSFGTLRPDPYILADGSSRRGPGTQPAPASVGELFRRPTVAAAVVALVVGQVVMVLIMTMTPLHMTEHGHDLGAVGLVISAHTVGMYALSPVSGRLTDRFGSLPVIFLGLATLAVAAAMAAAAPAEGGVLLFLALFLLGYGWNLGFVAGSALLASGLELHERTRLEGVTDSLIWGSAAAASLTSGIVMAAGSFAALGLLGLALVAIPAWVLASKRSAIRAVA